MQTLTILVFVVTIAYVHSGLLKVPKIYNAVITSDANLEPSRTYPIVQPVLSVGVQPVIAAAAIPAVPHPAEKQYPPQQIGGYYPIALGGLYPFLSGSNHLYPTVYYQQQPQYASGIYHQQQHELQPYPQAHAQAQPPQQEQPHQYQQPQPNLQVLPLAPQQPQNHQESPSSAMQVPDSSHHHADPFNNHHRFKNPGIPDVPPPPLPVSASKKSS